MQVVLYEDGFASRFGPLTLLRPVFDLRCGALLMREKLERRRPDWRVALLPRAELADVVSEEHPGRDISCLDGGPTLLLSAAVLVDGPLVDSVGSGGSRVLVSAGRVVGAYLESGAREMCSRGTDLTPAIESMGLDQARGPEPRVVTHTWDLVAETPGEIGLDAATIGGRGEIAGVVSDSAVVVEPARVTIASGSTVGPGVVLDATSGDVLLGRGVVVMPNAVIVGPVSIGDGVQVRAGARIYGGTSIGPVCKVGGEISASVMQSHSNKQHDGFLGHSFVGSWVNLGAGTDTSDLRNDYGVVRVEMGGESVDTRSASVGATIGDHSKTAIGTKLNTGTIVGAFCSVFPGVFPPKHIPSFSWGTREGFVRYELERAIDTARRVMARRGVELSHAREALIRRVYERTLDCP